MCFKLVDVVLGGGFQMPSGLAHHLGKDFGVPNC